MNGNPFAQVIQLMNMGRDPMGMLRQMAGQNPQMAQAMKMLQGKNAQQLQTMAQNMAQERGTTVQEVIQRLGIHM